MKSLLLFMVTFVLFGCSRPEIKNPEDIIAADAKAVIYSPSLESVLSALPQELFNKSKALYALAEKDKPIALVLTSLDPVQLYIAIPAKKGSEENLQKTLQTRMGLKCEFWSGYVFVALKGSIPSTFGNKDFLPSEKDTVLYIKAYGASLVAGKEDVLESYKAEPIKAFRRILTRSQNKILSRFITHDILGFADQIDELEVSCDQEGIEVRFQFTSGSNLAKSYNSMKEFKLPKLDEKGTDMAFALAADFGEMDFPVKGLETAFKSYLSLIDKPEAIFPMDTVFNKLRAAKQIRGIGAFSVVDDDLEGEALFTGKDQKLLNESVFKFTSLMAPDYFSKMVDDGNGKRSKILKSLYLPRKVVNTGLNLMVEPERIFISDKENYTGSLENSDEQGLLKLVLKASHFTVFDTGNKKVKVQVSVEEDVLKFKAKIKK